MSLDSPILEAIDAIPAGAWAVGVSGGADSVALVRLVESRKDLRPHVVHLDHQTRGGASAADAEFVRGLSQRHGLSHTIATREQVERITPNLPANVSARFRALRLALYRRVIADNGLAGVLLAHHGDDQAETVVQRLLRGSGVAGLAGMPAMGRVGGVTIRRPLLGVGRAGLRDYLRSIGQDWREDASNASQEYQRNRVRRWLADRPALTPMLLELSRRCRAWKDWADARAPDLPAACPLQAVRGLPSPLERVSLARWLAVAGVPESRIDRAVLDRLARMCRDAASPAKAAFPRNVIVRRRQGVLTAESRDDSGKRRAGNAK